MSISKRSLRELRAVAVSALRAESGLPMDTWLDQCKRRDVLSGALAEIVGLADSQLSEHTELYPDQIASTVSSESPDSHQHAKGGN